MVKQTAKIEKYEGNNIYFVGKEKPLFIEPTDIKAAMTNFPAGKVVTYKTKDKQKGTLDGMAEPTANEMKSYHQDQKAAEAASKTPSEFQPASTLPRDPDAEKEDAKKILQQNLKDKIAEGTGCTPSQEPACTPSPAPTGKPACFKPALCPKRCDGTKDPCQFKPKVPANPPAEPPKKAPSSETPAKPTPPPTTAQDALNQSQGREMLESLVNADPRALDYIAEHEPELWEAFCEKILGIMPEKKPAELKLPTESELVSMTLNYDTYWKSKALADIIARHDIRRQVEFKNRLECINTAITYCHLGSPGKSPKSEEVYKAAWDIYDTITKKINEVK